VGSLAGVYDSIPLVGFGLASSRALARSLLHKVKETPGRTFQETRLCPYRARTG
jgi:hypothetical protein